MSLTQRVFRTYRSNGIYALLREGFEYYRRHPIRLRYRARLRMLTQSLFTTYSALADPLKIIHVSPSRITKSSQNGFDPFIDIGRIVEADWDKNVYEFKEKNRFQSVRMRFEEGYQWEETPIYEYYLEMIEKDGRYDGCYSPKDVQERYSLVDEMYKTMAENGYDETKVENKFDHICVHISRDGEFIHASGGNHRLSVAKILDLDKIPVRVAVRHAEWQNVREMVFKNKAEIDELEHHPDLHDILGTSCSTTKPNSDHL